MKRLILAALVIALAASVTPAQAQVDAPLFSTLRLSVGLGANYEFTNNPFEGSEPVQDRKQEFTAGLYAAYNLTPDASLIGSSTIGMSSKQVRTTLGVRIRVFRGDK